MKLIKGKLENLCGRVAVYSKVEGDFKGYFLPNHNFRKIAGLPKFYGFNGLVSFYASMDMGNIAKVVGGGDEMEKSLDLLVEDHKRKCAPECGVAPNEIGVVMQSPVLFKSEEDIIGINCDVLFAGRYSDPSIALDSVKSAADFYTFELNQQWQIRKGNPGNRLDIAEGNVGQFIEREYLSKLFHAISREPELLKLKLDLINSVRGRNLSRDVLAICGLVNSFAKPNVKLIEAYVGKIKAIESQDFESAARYRDQIKNFEESS